jgi:hypothetical protein
MSDIEAVPPGSLSERKLRMSFEKIERQGVRLVLRLHELAVVCGYVLVCRMVSLQMRW